MIMKQNFKKLEIIHVWTHFKRCNATSGFSEQGRNSTSKSLLGIIEEPRPSPPTDLGLAGACCHCGLEGNSCQGAWIAQLSQQPSYSQCQGTTRVKPAPKPWHKDLTLCRKRRKFTCGKIIIREQVWWSTLERKKEITTVNPILIYPLLPFSTCAWPVSKIVTYWIIWKLMPHSHFRYPSNRSCWNYTDIQI